MTGRRAKGGAADLAAKFPRAFHVTDRANLPGIARDRFGRPTSPRDGTIFRPVSEDPRGDRKRPKELVVRGGTGPGLAHDVLER